MPPYPLLNLVFQAALEIFKNLFNPFILLVSFFLFGFF